MKQTHTYQYAFQRATQRAAQYLLLAALLTSLLFLPAACASREAAGEKIRPVSVLEVKEETQALQLEYIGTLTSREVIKYSFKVPGKIASIPVKKGDPVSNGQELAVLEQSDYQTAYKAAQLTTVKARAVYQDAANILQKMTALYGGGAISKNDLDKAQLDADVKKTALEQAQLDEDLKQRNLDDTTLKAGSDGFVADILFKAGEITAAGYPAVLVRSSDQVVKAGLSQTDVRYVRIGGEAQVIVGEAQLKGTVTNIDQVPDAQSRTYQAEVTLQDKLPDGSFYLGSTARVLFNAGETKGIWIPVNCIRTDGEDYVYTAVQDRAARKNIHILKLMGNLALVEGLSPGDLLISEGFKTLSEGSRVEIKSRTGAGVKS